MIKKAGEFLRESRGVTLVEVMMAVAVLGIIIVFITQMTGTGSRITVENLDQARMMELARAEAERLKAAYRTDPDSLPPDGYSTVLGYPPDAAGGAIQQTYAIMYKKEEYNGIMLKIIMGPSAGIEPAPPDPDDPDSYVLVVWLPE